MSPSHILLGPPNDHFLYSIPINVLYATNGLIGFKTIRPQLGTLVSGQKYSTANSSQATTFLNPCHEL